MKNSRTNVTVDLWSTGLDNTKKSETVAMRTRITGLLAAAVSLLAVLATGLTHHGGSAPAAASVPTALQLADHGLTTVVGPDDEGSYRLIDPIGPGGVRSVEAADEVYASTLQGGKYRAWQEYRDPFAPTPNGPPSAGPYPAGGGAKPYGGGGR